jgi:hypothetical protein
MLLQTVLAVVLAATNTAAPSPEPTIPTIITVHSSPYCTALSKTISPALVGLMHNDALIEVGRSAMLSMDRDFKYGGLLVSSWGSTGPAAVEQMPGKVHLFDYRLQLTARALQHNVDVVDTILATGDNTLKPSNADEQASLASIKAQLGKIAGEQKAAINLLNGTAETQELDQIFNASTMEAPSDMVAIQPWHSNTLNGVSPLTSMLSNGQPAMGVAGDPTLAVTMMKAKAQTSGSFPSPYAPLVQALTDEQFLIGAYEDTASKNIVAGSAGCK